jgi:hypothetical protein
MGSTTAAEAIQCHVQNSQGKRWMQYDDYETRTQEKTQARLTDFLVRPFGLQAECSSGLEMEK